MSVGRKPVVPKRRWARPISADGIDRRFGVEQHAAAAVYLRVQKARQQQMATEVVADRVPTARVVVGDDVDDPPSVEQYGAVIDDAVVTRARGR